MHHPWRAFRKLKHIRLLWRDLPEGVLGVTDHAAGVVTLTTGMLQRERRCTIAHETQHVLRGPVPAWLQPREELAVDAEAARLLLPDIHAVGEALAWAHHLDEAAEELWVDEPTLVARLKTLHPSERHYLKRRLEG